MRANWAAVVFFLFTLFLSACDLITDTGNTEPIPAPTATLDQMMLTQAAPNVPNVDLLATPTQQSTALRLWIPPAIAVRTETGAVTLSDQLFAYEAEHPDVTLIVEQKKPSGPGGILSYLRTGRDVAPSVMPDLIAIPADLLPTMAAENLVAPLDERLDGAAMDALFPPAQTLGRPESTILGYPFALSGLPHLTYNSNVLTGTLPLTWDRLIANEDHLYVFAADGFDGSLLALEFYLEAGGQLATEAGQPLLQVEPLTQALQKIQDGRDLEFFAPQSSTFNITDQAWQSFLSGGGNIAQTTTDHFLGQTVAGMPIAYTVIPGIDSPLTPLVSGWAWAITTSDPARQEEAVKLIQSLTSAANLAAWSRDSNILPARRDALEAWPDQEPYTVFARQELERAQPLAISPSGKIVTVLSDAVFQVVSGAKTAPQAAADAVNAMQS
jgi:ABC-type glycerol-3-phosphate transport system substrate-binding protein